MIGEHQERVPELVDLLNAIVKVDGLDMPLKRNQAYVMKYVMQSYSKVAAILDQPINMRFVSVTSTVGFSSNLYQYIHKINSLFHVVSSDPQIC